MLNKVAGSGSAERVKHDIDAFTPSQLCCRHEITVCRNDHNLVDLTLECERSNVEAEAHINPFLLYIVLEVVIARLELIGILEKPFQRVWLEAPRKILV
jgi:hypothetical protein